MKTVEEYLAAIDETFAKADTAAMHSIVEHLKSIDNDIAYNVLTTAMGLGSRTADIDIKKVGWVHRHAVGTVLQIIKEREGQLSSA